MQTTMNFNSIDIYKHKVLPEIKGRKKQVLDALIQLGGKATMYEVGQLLNLPLNHISGRFKELLNTDKISVSGSKEHRGNKFTIWEVKKAV